MTDSPCGKDTLEDITLQDICKHEWVIPDGIPFIVNPPAFPDTVVAYCKHCNAPMTKREMEMRYYAKGLQPPWEKIKV